MDTITIGRSPECSINVSDSFATVSNEHAEIQLVNGQLKYIDHSSNGTLINGLKLHRSEQIIKRGDKILLAGVYELNWSDLEKYFPTLHRPTEMFDGSQVEAGVRKTEMFDGSQLGNHARETERFDGTHGAGTGQTEPLNVPTNGEKARGQVNEFTQAEVEELMEKWHLGAFFSSWFWALCNRLYWPLIIIPISFVPYLGQVASLFLCTYLGLNGYRIAWSKSKTDDFRAFMSDQKKWTVIGIVLFAVFAAIQAFSLYTIL